MYTSGWPSLEGIVLTVEHSPTQLQGLLMLLMLWPGGSPPASLHCHRDSFSYRAEWKHCLSLYRKNKKKKERKCITLLKAKKSSDILIYFHKLSLMGSMKEPFLYKIPAMSGRMGSLRYNRELASCLCSFGFKRRVFFFFPHFQTVLHTALAMKYLKHMCIWNAERQWLMAS